MNKISGKSLFSIDSILKNTTTESSSNARNDNDEEEEATENHHDDDKHTNRSSRNKNNQKRASIEFTINKCLIQRHKTVTSKILDFKLIFLIA